MSRIIDRVAARNVIIEGETGMRRILDSKMMAIAALCQSSLKKMTGRARVVMALSLMCLSAASAAGDITISGNISLSNTATSTVMVSVSAYDESGTDPTGGSQPISFVAGDTIEPFSFPVSDIGGASWRIEVICESGCDN